MHAIYAGHHDEDNYDDIYMSDSDSDSEEDVDLGGLDEDLRFEEFLMAAGKYLLELWCQWFLFTGFF